MNLISTFRQQHDHIEQVASEISQQLNSSRLATDAAEIRKKLRNFLMHLRIHNTLEEDALHSSLLNHQNKLVADEASRLMGEAAIMGREVEEYRRYWLKMGSIEKRPNDFIEETQMLLTVIHDRFDRENRDLFVQVEGELTH